MSKSSLSEAFEPAASIQSPTRNRPPPFSIRFSFEERARLDRDSGSLSWAAYIRLKLFGEKEVPKPRLTKKRRRRSIDHAALGRALAVLGKSRLAANLNQIAKSANTGSLPVTPELEQELVAACADIRAMR